MKPQHYQLNVLKERCKGCELCIEFCPRQVIHESPEFNRKGYHPVYADSDNDCLDCGLCELICPEFAISVLPLLKKKRLMDKKGHLMGEFFITGDIACAEGAISAGCRFYR